MRLAVWCTSYFSSVGGAEKVANDLLNRCAARGIHSFLIAGCDAPGGASRHYALNPAVRIYQNRFLNPFDYLHRPHVFVVKLFQYIRAVTQLASFLRQNEIDVVHLHFVSFDVVLLVLYKYLLGYRLLITFAGSDVRLAMRSTWAGLKVRLALRFADCATAVSRDLCAALATRFGTTTRYIPNGVDREELLKLAAASSSPVDADDLIYCGRLTAVKRVPFLIAAFRECLVRGCDRKLYIIGDGEEAPGVTALISSHGLQDRIIALGRLPHAQVLNAISRSRCLLLASSNEGCPMVVLEALALGTPVIAPDVGGLKEVLLHGENGYLYPPDRDDLLCDSIMKIVKNKTLADVLGSRGPSSIAGKFDLDAVVDRYCQIYGLMISSSRLVCA